LSASITRATSRQASGSPTSCSSAIIASMASRSARSRFLLVAAGNETHACLYWHRRSLVY
jgi:hypothetical protein